MTNIQYEKVNMDIMFIIKQKKMKKPQFLKYNDEKDDNVDCRIEWIENNNIDEIKNYICKKYNIII